MSVEDIVLVQQLVCREREARDRLWWDEMRSIYTEDSWIDLSWYQGSGKGFIDRSIDLAKRGTSSKHRLGPVVVRVSEDRGRALATVSAVIESRFKLNGIEVDIGSETRLIYKGVKNTHDHKWRLSGLSCIYECDHLRPAIPGQTINIDPEELKPYRSSYRCLSYFLSQQGLSVRMELPGDDRPEQVIKLYDDAFRWLRVSGSSVANRQEYQHDGQAQSLL
ncbi:uncharacterized protein A1O9_02232 [Exophiala aquamarina CBS 119918]|uniref:SnoaL-like domain-containing protein n=1 Tax=Exophiala aquamarina CBS 119918 TaxID=1182545 RepID=A0A072PLB3_9EURO|nr:uncharacterized protein A1O9_02232 [Exophiala aquamarina CBS 119918]KEF60671.1 hypothetical protein A1O9_02232 [Exophiala aquamarina CBS 119918]